MTLANHVYLWRRAGTGLLLLLLLVGLTEDAQAQWTPKWLNVGDLQTRYLSGGAAPEGDEVAWHHPGIRPRSAYSRWRGMWIATQNFTDENGRLWENRISHIGPRITGVGQVFDISQALVSRYPQPTVEVDGAATFAEPVVVDEVDPSLAPDRMVLQEINTSVGITLNQRAMQWSHPDHENYHIVEYVFTSTGNVDGDDEIEISDNNVDNVFFVFLERPTGAGAFSGAWDNSAGGVAWGQYTMNDAIGDGVSDYGVDFRAQFAWLGNIQAVNSLEFNTLGNPFRANHQWNSLADDTLGRLGSASFSGVVTLHADTEAHEPGASSPDDPAQPYTMTYLNSDYGDLTSTSDHNNEVAMARERRWIECGSTGSAATNDAAIASDLAGNCTPGTSPRSWPTHARLVQGQDASAAFDSDPDFINQTADPTRGAGAGGWGFMTAYGPYDMSHGQEVRIVWAEAVAALSDEAEWEIGRAYKLSGWDDSMIHEFDADGNGTIDADEAMTKNEWVFTARDSLFQTFQRALDNFNNGFNAPHPPPPPTSFVVTSGTDKIDISWTASQAPAGGWELWRAQKHYSGIMTTLETNASGIGVPDVARSYELVATLPGSATSFEDTQVVRGGSYYYYLQAVGSDGTRSSRYYTQTYNPAFLRRPSVEGDLSRVRIVPNPFHLGADPAVRLDVQDRIAFYDLPGQARIDIYTELGELVRTIEHTDGSGDDFWDLTTSSRQLVVSGIYLANITNTATGESAIQKFIIIR